jgi:hypothetical protein
VTERVVAIHQPNFLPWLGYFDKLARADVFVLLDDAQFPKKGGNWTNRVRMSIDGSSTWMTVPVVRAFSGYRSIREMEIDESRPWRTKMSTAIAQAYSRADHFDETMPLVEELIQVDQSKLATYNENAIRRLADELGLTDTEIVRSSDLAVTSQATQRLVDLVRAVGGTAYLAGGGAGGYQEDDLFADAGLGLVTQDFSAPAYPQLVDPPTTGLSIVDALLNVGLGRTGELLASKST